jgi:hypothetical protein
MMRKNIKNKKQAGFAALLIVLVTGLAAAAIVFAQVAYVQGSQQVANLLKSTTPTQAKAWAAADAVRIALGEAPSDYIEGLTVGQSIPVEFSNTSAYIVTVNVVKNAVVNSANELTLRILAKDNGFGNFSSSTALLVTYYISANPCIPDLTCPKPVTPYTIVIRGEMINSGVLRFLGSAGSAFVDGNVALSGSSDSFETLCSTGDVEIGSGIHINSVCADGDFHLMDSASVTSAQIKGSVALRSTRGVDALLSNGDVVVSSGSVGSLKTKGNIEVNQTGRVDKAESEGDVNWTSSLSATEIHSNGAVINYMGDGDQAKISTLGPATLSGNVRELHAIGDIDLITARVGNGVKSVMATNGNFRYIQGQTFVNSGTVGGVISPPIDRSVTPLVNVTRASQLPVVNIPRVVVPIVKPVPVNIIGIDATYLRDSANYLFTVDSQNRIVVRVRSVTGIEDGQYYLGAFLPSDTQSLGRDYLCKRVRNGTVNGKLEAVCQLPVSKNLARTICNASAALNACFGYDPSTKTWSIDSSTLASGAMFFDGNLSVNTGNYSNALIASGNIRLAGRTALKAMNFAGYDEVCKARTVNGAPSTLTDGIFPSNICDFGNSILRDPLDPIGNAILVAGAYAGDAFSGGDITFVNALEIFGTVLAGNSVAFGTTSSTQQVVTIHGRLVASGQRGVGAISQFNGYVNFVLDDFPSTFDAGLTPCMSSGCQINATQSAMSSMKNSVSPSNAKTNNGTSPSAVALGAERPLATMAGAASLSAGALDTENGASSSCTAGCTAGSVSQVRVYWASYD